ncbi:hypothetical protein JCM10207_003504 [Rhodosporidiobolus poonsookiae]
MSFPGLPAAESSVSTDSTVSKDSQQDFESPRTQTVGEEQLSAVQSQKLNAAKTTIENDVDYRKNGWTVRHLFPPQALAHYQAIVKSQVQPSISSELLNGLDAAKAEIKEWRRFEALETEMLDALDAMPFGSVALDELLIGMEVQARKEKRQEAVLWLDDLWQRCHEFERADDITSEARARERFMRFPPMVFPTLEERNEAELKALGK